MKTDWFVRALLAALVVFLGVIALRPYVFPPPAQAQAQDLYPLYIEPDVYPIRVPDGTGEFLGKIVVDMRNGNVWGFPTGSKLPYPIKLLSEGPTSRPIYLGKFDFAALNKKAAPPSEAVH
jgi:hypothetical protein